MTRFEAVDDIRKALLELMMVHDSVADDDAVAQAFHGTYLKLVDRFYHENQDMFLYQQYQAAKNDPEYFMQLVLLACRHYEDLH
jgi:hypothetical protein